MEHSHLNWLETTRSYTKCPKCKKGDLSVRIHRGYVVKHLLFWTDLKRYQCNNCGAKVYLRGN